MSHHGVFPYSEWILKNTDRKKRRSIHTSQCQAFCFYIVSRTELMFSGSIEKVGLSLNLPCECTSNRGTFQTMWLIRFTGSSEQKKKKKNYKVECSWWVRISLVFFQFRIGSIFLKQFFLIFLIYLNSFESGEILVLCSFIYVCFFCIRQILFSSLVNLNTYPFSLSKNLFSQDRND